MFSLNKKGNTLYSAIEYHCKKKKKKPKVLNLVLGSGRIFLLTRSGGRSILGLRISFFGLGLHFLRLCYSFFVLSGILGLWGGLFLFTLTLVFTSLSLLAGSLRSLSGKESILDSQGLLRSVWGDNGRGRDGTGGFTNVWMVVYAP